MERLTIRDKNGEAHMICKQMCGDYGNGCEGQIDVDMCQRYVAFDKLAEYEDLEEQGLLLKLPCKVGDTVYIDSSALPIEDMECYEDVENPIPQSFIGRVVSFRFAKRNWMKIAVKTTWLFEFVDEETGPDAKYIDCEKNFSFPLSAIGKTVFLTQGESEAKLKESEV